MNKRILFIILFLFQTFIFSCSNSTSSVSNLLEEYNSSLTEEGISTDGIIAERIIPEESYRIATPYNPHAFIAPVNCTYKWYWGNMNTTPAGTTQTYEVDVSGWSVGEKKKLTIEANYQGTVYTDSCYIEKI